MGTFIGALTLGIIANGLVLLKVDVFWVPITQCVILIVAMLLNQSAVDRFQKRKAYQHPISHWPRRLRRPGGVPAARAHHQ